MGVDELVIVNNNIKRVNSSDMASSDSKKVIPTSSSFEAACEILSSSPRVVNFVGGDGTFSDTLNEVLKVEPGFLDSSFVKLSPFGSGNDKYRFLEDNVNGGGVFRDDFLEVTINDVYKRFVFNVGGIGLDAQGVIEYDNLSRGFSSSLRYVLASARAIGKLNGYQGILKYDAKFFEKDNMSSKVDVIKPVMFLFMVGKYFGNGMPINEGAVFDDGNFESAYFSRGSNFSLYKSLAELSFLKKPQINNGLASYFKHPLSRLDLSVLSYDDFYFQSDGEVLKDRECSPVPVKELSVKPAGKVNYLV